MLLDISPYKFWKKKTDPASMDDATVDKELAKSKFILDNIGEYAAQVAYAAYFAFPIVAWGVIGIAGTMAVAGTACIAAIGTAYAVYKGGSMLLSKGIARAVRDKNDLTAETQVREVRRQAKAKQMAIEQQEREIAAIRARAQKAKEDFNAALDAGLPLAEAIQVRKAPISFKSGIKRGFFKPGF